MLDEGIDVPDANLGIVMSASRTRRQMIQRMGRILRRKRPGIAARFVIMFAKDTLEDPANRIDRDGFLDEIERICEANGVFDGAALRRARRVPRRRPVRRWCPSRSSSSATSAPWCARSGEASLASEATVEHLAEQMGVEAAYAFLSFADPDPSGAARRRRHPRARSAPSEARTDGPRRTWSSSSPNLPPIATPRVERPRLSTGQAPLEIARVGDAWRISCTGCGEASVLVQFRWQVLDQTVDCRCN